MVKHEAFEFILLPFFEFILLPYFHPFFLPLYPTDYSGILLYHCHIPKKYPARTYP